jgi:hypothetical protein
MSRVGDVSLAPSAKHQTTMEYSSEICLELCILGMALRHKVDRGLYAYRLRRTEYWDLVDVWHVPQINHVTVVALSGAWACKAVFFSAFLFRVGDFGTRVWS